MPSLTPQVWEEHFRRLRPYVVERWPEVDEGRLDAIAGDFEALTRTVASAAAIPEETAREQLHSIDVEEADIVGPDDRARPAGLAQLRLGPGFTDDERPMVVSNLERLERQLQRFPADGSELEVSVQQRGETSQEVVLEAWLPKLPHIAATSGHRDLGTALREVRDALWRQINDAMDRRKEHP